MHVYVCILCVCLRRPKPFVCRPTHRERIIYGQRERETIEIDERPAFGRRMRALLVPLQHPIEHVSRRPRKDICHHLSFFVCVCVCCVLCLERVLADAPSSSSPLFFSYSLIRGGSMRLILSFFSQCLSAFTAHRPRDRNICARGSPFIFCSNMRWIGVEC